jgi:transposase-like protein
VLLSEQRDTAAARRFFTRALRYGPAPVEVTTDKAVPYLRVLDELVPTALHVTELYANNRIEADHGRLKARLARCEGSHASDPLKYSPLDTPSSRTSAVDTTSSPPMTGHTCGLRARSPSWR